MLSSLRQREPQALTGAFAQLAGGLVDLLKVAQSLK